MWDFIFQSEENHSSQSNHHNGIKENSSLNPALPPKSPSQDVLNSRGQNIATITNIDIDIQPEEHRDKLRKAKPPRPATSAAKQAEREEQKKADTVVPQAHPGKQESVVLSGKVEHSPQHMERLEPVKDNSAPNVNMSVEEDTMKLLQQVATEDQKTGKQDATEAKEGQKAEAGHHSGDRWVRYTL